MNHRYVLGILFMFVLFAAGCGAADPDQISMEETTGFHTLDPEPTAEILAEGLNNVEPSPPNVVENNPSIQVVETTPQATPVYAGGDIPEFTVSDNTQSSGNQISTGNSVKVATTIGAKSPGFRDDREEFDPGEIYAEAELDQREEGEELEYNNTISATADDPQREDDIDYATTISVNAEEPQRENPQRAVYAQYENNLAAYPGDVRAEGNCDDDDC